MAEAPSSATCLQSDRRVIRSITSRVAWPWMWNGTLKMAIWTATPLPTTRGRQRE